MQKSEGKRFEKEKDVLRGYTTYSKCPAHPQPLAAPLSRPGRAAPEALGKEKKDLPVHEERKGRPSPMRLEVGRTLFRSHKSFPFSGRSFLVAPRVSV